jgi:hypothetical protein
MRAHTKACEMAYDVRYEPYFEKAGLLPFMLQFKRAPPTINHSALTALLDRWQPETQTFHLPCGDMMVTLEDFAMITALPLEGETCNGRVERSNWRQRITNLIGDCRPSIRNDEENVKDNRTSGIPFIWLLANRSGCPQNANAQTVEQYARAYLWYLLSQVVFPDCSVDIALSMYLDFLADWEVKHCWGLLALHFYTML